ncbi:universal stress protein [Rhodococcus sp. X156]|uniref:universal stress protein n=1 Tax=Rhodococcus sp. X156 TaxID=2499145 RepID=UPI000FDAA59C|nr:universal stress protein [Rhodococcus sp. X156]
MTTPRTTPASPRVVVGIDGSAPSEQALRWARFLADTTGAGVEAVAVWRAPSTYGWAGISRPEITLGWDPAADAHRLVVETVQKVFGTPTFPGLTVTVREGNTVEVLLELSGEAQVLVVGSRGRGGFSGMLLGSVSAACAEHATCPVMVVHGTTPPPPRP